jgi:hypothetical protein
MGLLAHAVAHALLRAAFTLSRKLAKARVYSECKSKQAVARKYTSPGWRKSELSAAKDVPSRDRSSLM